MGNYITTSEGVEVPVEVSGNSFSPATVTAYLDSEKMLFSSRFENPMKNNANIDDFERLVTLGTGFYARVMLVKKKSCGTYFAMKIIRKQHVVKAKKVKSVLQEKQILQAVNFSFVVNIKYAFKDNANLFMVLPFVPGGELFTCLVEASIFTEEQARFYAAQVILAFEYLHSLDVIYRDLKPENIVLDEHGYIKLVDFGFAKVVNGRTWTICGTPGYIAPEIILRQGHSRPVDWWTLGILIFEFTAGFCPFGTSEQKDWANDTITCRVKAPKRFSSPLRDLLRKLIMKDVTKRYGNLKNGIADIKNHSWFEDTNWVSLYYKTMEPPFKPFVEHPGSTMNFDSYEEEDIAQESENLFPAKFEDF